MLEIELISFIKKDLALNNQKRLICHKSQTNNRLRFFSLGLFGLAANFSVFLLIFTCNETTHIHTLYITGPNTDFYSILSFLSLSLSLSLLLSFSLLVSLSLSIHSFILYIYIYIYIYIPPDKSIKPPSKMKKKYCLQFLNYENTIYERLG